jgi:hypothetical protein
MRLSALPEADRQKIEGRFSTVEPQATTGKGRGRYRLMAAGAAKDCLEPFRSVLARLVQSALVEQCKNLTCSAFALRAPRGHATPRLSLMSLSFTIASLQEDEIAQPSRHRVATDVNVNCLAFVGGCFLTKTYRRAFVAGTRTGQGDKDELSRSACATCRRR